MKRALLLGVLVGVGALSMAVSALPGLPERLNGIPQQAVGGAQPMVVEVEKLKDNLYLMRGGGGNSAVFITASGVIVVDTKNPGWGQPLLEKIKSVTGKPVTMITGVPGCSSRTARSTSMPSSRALSLRSLMTRSNGFDRQRASPCSGSLVASISRSGRLSSSCMNRVVPGSSSIRRIRDVATAVI